MTAIKLPELPMWAKAFGLESQLRTYAQQAVRMNAEVAPDGYRISTCMDVKVSFYFDTAEQADAWHGRLIEAWNAAALTHPEAHHDP